MAKNKTIYICTECGNEFSNWAGKCTKCGAWNTIKELEVDRINNKSTKSTPSSNKKYTKLSDINSDEESRYSTGISEFDRVLGGGAVLGSLVLVGGSPGIGKSTLLLQMCNYLDNDLNVLYISGEESERQIKLRAERLNISNNINILTETDIDNVIDNINQIISNILIIDSIQTMTDYSIDSISGSISQVRGCTLRLMKIAKDLNITVFIIGQINKDGNIAGPKVLEHMVDCVLYFEGEQNTSFRILRAIKNRFGSTNEIGVFEMDDKGLKCISNPSELLLSGRPINSPGNCVTCIQEGTRPLLAEVQALICPTTYNASRKTNGVDYNRISMLLAVTEKRGGLKVINSDAYINVIGGITLLEPAADLSIVLAIASSFLDKPIDNDIVALGEVGLAGEIRNVSNINHRLTEISRLGFKKCIIPSQIKDEITDNHGLNLIPVTNINDAIKKIINR